LTFKSREAIIRAIRPSEFQGYETLCTYCSRYSLRDRSPFAAPVLFSALLWSDLQDEITLQGCRYIERPTMIPKHTVILLAGIPATGKTEFARYLAREHDFAHYDMERFPSGGPRQVLHGIWEKSRPAFVAFLRQEHPRVVLDWGFPPSCIARVNELRSCGVRLVWFEGDVALARKLFIKRGGPKGSIEGFGKQVEAIKAANFPAALNCVVVPALSAKESFLDREEVER